MNQLHLSQRCLLPVFTLHCVVWKNQVHQPFPSHRMKSTVQPQTLFSHVVTHRKVTSFTPMQRNKTRFFVCVFNAQSVGPKDKRTEIVEFICDECIDMFLTETWMRSHGDEAKYADLTPPGYSMRSIPRATLGGGLAVILRDNSLSPSQPHFPLLTRHLS